MSLSRLIYDGIELPSGQVLPSHFPIGSCLRILNTFYGKAKKAPLERSRCADPAHLL